MEKKSLADALVLNYSNNGGRITPFQVGQEIYDQWNAGLKNLFKTALKLYKDKTWALADLDRLPEHKSMYEQLAELSELIGDVNGYPISRTSDMGRLMIGYTKVTSADKKAGINPKDYNLRRELFDLRVEKYFARLIILQRLKAKQILMDENEDKRFIRRIKQQRARLFAEEQPESVPIPTMDLHFTSIVVLGNISYCNKNHTLESIIAVVDVLKPSGNIEKATVSAGYCKECNLYFMLDSDFRTLREKGVLLCQLISKEIYDKGIESPLSSFNLKTESLLHRCGYNVNAVNNLTAVQRQEILRRVVDNKLYAKIGLMSFLDWLIKHNGTLKNMSSAVEKWKADRAFVEHLTTDGQQIKIGKITYHQ